MIVKNDLFDYKDRYIYQNPEFFKFSLDSILLAEFFRRFKGNNILDMCAGNMAIPLIISTFFDKKIIGFEIQKEVYDLGIKSINENKLENKLELINDDIKNLNNYYPSGFFDTFICNPPFFKLEENMKMVTKERIKSIARHEITLSLEDIFILCKKSLKNRGNLLMVHRVNRLDEIIFLGYKYQVYIKDVFLISTKEDENPSIVLIKAVKDGNPDIKVHKELCVSNMKSYQNMFEE